jgi:hypothetical protein
VRFAYADPPYVGSAKKYRKHKDYAGEVDMAELVTQLCCGYDGWALSLSVKSLRMILPMCPDGIITGAWFKSLAPPLGDHRRYNWEPVIVRPVRRYEPGYVPLAMISASVDGYTFRETPEEHVEGQKPEAFAHWVFALAGLTLDDVMTDLFPGSGAVSQAWATYKPGPTVSDGYASREA